MFRFDFGVEDRRFGFSGYEIKFERNCIGLGDWFKKVILKLVSKFFFFKVFIMCIFLFFI